MPLDSEGRMDINQTLFSLIKKKGRLIPDVLQHLVINKQSYFESTEGKFTYLRCFVELDPPLSPKLDYILE